MQSELAVGLSELTAALLSTSDIEGSLYGSAEAISRMLPGQPMTAISIARTGRAPLTAASCVRARAADAIQYHLGCGPGLEAIETRQPIKVVDAAGEHRWGEYPTQVLAHGVRSIHSEPMAITPDDVGILNLYSAQPHEFDHPVTEAITLTAAHTGVLLSAVLATARQAALTDQLLDALASRSVIDQALGIVMGRRHCGREEAFAVLRETSQHRNIKLAVVAARLIHTVTGSWPEEPHFGAEDTRRAPRRYPGHN
ncbi:MULTISPECIES: GAF and ANTAR domain-containing protein [unclassified Nocardia]|uniref:GAF and ANTAR domain-containing protein n=1 Tax=unclassified Nocardia TaxID=2637762 RepID=UPI0024A80B19|nr:MULTISPECIES: GAF and ANTAR domain-containing protein [unclassified Nocardia]